MDLSLIADTVTVSATKQGQGLALGFLKPEPSSPSNNNLLQISAVIFPTDALAPPPVKSNSHKTVPRTLLLKKRRTRRRSLTGDDSEDGVTGFSGSGGYDGPFGGGGGDWRGGGRGWNSDGFGGQDWEEFSPDSSWSSPALNFAYEVVTWIALSNCMHFAFKKMVRMIVVADAEREKVVVPMC
ncbi:hypothetical protein CFOL_v3_07686 [Cephalotus follicularis]|uniref:Uncharacterized protein n=1 Tax=Cephalotus follicularis TaxID=3775 RepID=A0A1Q3B845_CEPFO|nr:hypothetical protein CFOL_v3_07686 [Cephalotus follicularis]